MSVFNNIKKHKFIWVISICCIVLIMLPYIWIKSLENQYSGWKDFEKTVLFPKLDALNFSVYSALPSPNGVKEITKSSSGGSNQHGRVLLIWYEYSNPELEEEDVFSFYDKYLSQNGWITTDYYYATSMSYYKDTSCISIDTHYSKFSIRIEHDYFQQSFSPTIDMMPPMEYIKLLEFGETIFGTCP